MASSSSEQLRKGTSSLTAASSTDKKKKKAQQPQASISETMSFVFGCGTKIKWIFVFSFFAGFLNGLVYPALAYLFSNSFSTIGAASNDGLKQVRELAFLFMLVGAYALLAGFFQNWGFEIIAYHASQRFRLQWFAALLKQDAAFFDVHDVAGIANQVGPNASKYRRGVGRKFGEGVQFLTTGLGGLAFAFYSSWRVALVVLTVIPFVSLAAMSVITLNQTKGTRAAAAYKEAGGVAYTAVSAIKTVLSLNAVPEMIRRYTEATQFAFQQAVGILCKQGLANGTYIL
jgi:ATP-binding cassette subfamily B (MDR/TAP) protein 1